MLMEPALRGFAIGASLIVAIGAQNAFILERGLVRSHVFALCLICAVSDALLIAAGVAGLGTIIASRPALILAVTLGGALFLYAYAAIAARRALRPAAMDVRHGDRAMSLKAAAATCLGLTFLNPHVYLDTVVLIGSLSARYGFTEQRIAYAAGAMTASFAWFFALGYGARLLAPLFARPGAWRILDGLIAFVMASLATSLLVTLL
nr:LysE/ArgO family amino acid transporter [Aureimonas sp. AU12]